MKRGERWFSEKLRIFFVLENVRSDSFSIRIPPVSRAPASELVLQRGGLPSEIALPGEASSPPAKTCSLSRFIIIMIQFWLRVNYCADSRLLSSKNDPVIKCACLRIRVLLCPESGTTVSLNWN